MKPKREEILGRLKSILGKEIAVTVGKAFTPTSAEPTMARRIDDVTGQVQRALEQTLPRYSEEPVAHKPLRWLTDLLK